jgi:hypothetical protein
MKRILKDLQKVDSQLSMDDIASSTSHLHIEWKEIADGTDHDAGDTEMKIVSKWRESRILRPNTALKGLETRTTSGSQPKCHYWRDCQTGCEDSGFF